MLNAVTLVSDIRPANTTLTDRFIFQMGVTPSARKRLNGSWRILTTDKKNRTIKCFFQVVFFEPVSLSDEMTTFSNTYWSFW
jgi:hypothetical protein